MDLLGFFLWPLRVFAFNPVLCAIVAMAFTVPVFVPVYSSGSRLVLGLCAVVWWGFCLLEATTSSDSAIRVDLVLLGPFIVVAAVVGAWHLARGHRRPESRQVGWRMSRRPLHRK